MKKIINIVFIFCALFCFLNFNIDKLSEHISHSQILEHFISQGSDFNEVIELKINNDRKYIAKSNNIFETIYSIKKPNQLGFNSTDNSSVLKNKDIFKILYKSFTNIIYNTPYNISSNLKNIICVRAP